MRVFSRFALCCGAAIAALLATSALADQQIGNVVQKDFNGATGLRLATAAADDLIFDRDVFSGETVKTPGSASTVIRFEDKTQIQVGANSTIVLDKFVYDPSTGTGDAAIKFGTGVFRFITGDIKNKDAVKLTFFRGAALDDPKKLFNSSLEGNTRRAIDIPQGKKPNEAAFKRLIQSAVAANVAVKSAPKARRAVAKK